MPNTTPNGRVYIHQGSWTCVQGAGTVTCYGGVPVLTKIPPLSGNTINQNFVAELAPYKQTDLTTGEVTWSLTDAAAAIAGLSIDPRTGTLTVADGYDAFTTEEGNVIVGVFVTGAYGRSNVVPLILSVSTYDVPTLRSIPAFVSDATYGDVTSMDLRSYLVDGVYAVPLTWSLLPTPPPPTGVSLVVTTDTNTTTTAPAVALVARQGTNVVDGSVTVVVTDRRGLRHLCAVPVQIRSAVRARYVRLRRTTGDDFMNIMEIRVFNGTTKLTPVTGGCTPPYLQNGTVAFPWTNLVDGNDMTFGHTGVSATGQMYLDFGAEYPITRITIINRNETVAIQNRIIGSTLTVETATGTVLWSNTFTVAAQKWDFTVV